MNEDAFRLDLVGSETIAFRNAKCEHSPRISRFRRLLIYEVVSMFSNILSV